MVFFSKEMWLINVKIINGFLLLCNIIFVILFVFCFYVLCSDICLVVLYIDSC